MNDPGTGGTPDPLFKPSYSQFCYEIRSCRGRPSTWIRLSCPPPPSRVQGTTILTVPTRLSRRNQRSRWRWTRALGERSRSYDHDPRVRRPDCKQLWVLRAVGHSESLQSEESNPPLWLWCRTGRRLQQWQSQWQACSSVTVGGIPLHGVSWSDTTITSTVQANVPLCGIQQQAQFGGFTGAVRPTGHHGGQRQAVDRYGDRHDRGKAPTHVLALTRSRVQ